ncbi:Ger(x)C family spore germination protein [Gracilibacillus thailandensis]|uniref:Ger(X)C family spore germination protein n=1 Tax=Gracilibacillus thailandensis TaxID=563735 RepID=A0A6N7QV73_9BACI|nr:Ger(x)C family spore germination protein [Gracilibacillus thailandensis]MRI65993.1 Ger(x)C family spore germination protein [Gracilibacillus thailandensis]
MKHLLPFLFCTIAVLLTGCWDELPIDERGFVIGSAIDMDDKKEKGEYDITLTSQFVIPGNLSSPTQDGGDKLAFKNISVTGQSAFQISREMLGLTNWIPNYEHLKILIVSSEVASEPNLFSSVVDAFIRDHEMRRGIKVMISDGAAKDVLGQTSETEELPARFIDKIMENNVKSLELIEPVRIGLLHRYLLNESSYMLPLLTSSAENVNYNGVAVFDGKSDQQVGTLMGDDIKGFRLIKGDIKNGILNFQIDGELMIYEISDARSSIKINAKNKENVKISISIDTEGYIAEMFGSKSLQDQAYIDKIEEEINKKIEEIVTKSVETAQDELKIDFFDFSNILRQKHYEDWKKIKGNWEHGDNLFSQSTVEISAKAIVRNIGASDKVKDVGMER